MPKYELVDMLLTVLWADFYIDWSKVINGDGSPDINIVFIINGDDWLIVPENELNFHSCVTLVQVN